MKILNGSLFQCLLVTTALCSLPLHVRTAKSATGSGQPSDTSWPRERYQNGNRLIVYQPQVDDWKNFQDLSWRMAVSVTPKTGKTVVGVVEMKGTTSVDNVNKLVNVSNLQITNTYFPSLDKATADKMEQVFKSFVPQT